MWRYQRITWLEGQNQSFWRNSLNILKICVRTRKNRKEELDIHYIYLICLIFRGLVWIIWWNEFFDGVKKYILVTQLQFMTKIIVLITLISLNVLYMISKDIWKRLEKVWNDIDEVMRYQVILEGFEWVFS